MFKLLVEHNANLDIKNRQGFTPLTLAAELCRDEVSLCPLCALSIGKDAHARV